MLNWRILTDRLNENSPWAHSKMFCHLQLTYLDWSAHIARKIELFCTTSTEPCVYFDSTFYLLCFVLSSLWINLYLKYTNTSLKVFGKARGGGSCLMFMTGRKMQKSVQIISISRYFTILISGKGTLHFFLLVACYSVKYSCSNKKGPQHMVH